MRAIVAVMVVFVASSAFAEEPRQLTKGDAGVSDVRLSWDGSKVVYALHRSGQLGGDVCVRDLASGTVTNLTESSKVPMYSEYGLQAQFAPDGQGVFFLHGGGLFLASLDGKTEKIELKVEARSILVVPGLDALLFTAESNYNPGDLKGKWPKGVAAMFLEKIFKLDLKTREASLFTGDLVADTGRMAIMPDGRLITIAHYPDKEGSMSGRSISIVDLKGKRRKLCPPIFQFPPVYLKGGRTIVTLDQVMKEGDEDFSYPLKTFDAKSRKKGKGVDLELAKGEEPGAMWSLPGNRDFLVAIGDYDKGYKIYRYDGKKKERTLVVGKLFGTADGGGVTPDGKHLYFTSGSPGTSRGHLWVLDL